MEQFEIQFRTDKYSPVRSATAITSDSDEAEKVLKSLLIEEGHSKNKIEIIMIEPQGIVAGHEISSCENMQV